MADQQLPLTITRTAACLSIIAVHQTGDSALPVSLGGVLSAFQNPSLQGAADLALNAAEYASSWTTLGATMGMEIAQQSNPIPRGGLNSSIEAFAMLPGKVTTTLTIQRALLYYEDAMSAFKFMPGNIALQTTPLIIIENLTVPDSPEIQKRFGSFAKKIGNSEFGLLQPNVYVGCRINSSRIKYDIEGNNSIVMQDITLSVARIINPLSETVSQVTGALQGLGLDGAASQFAGASTVLASNVSIVNKITG